LAWIVFPLIFFSFSGSKLPGYILPALPAVALLAGIRLAQLNAEAKKGWALKATGALGILLAIALPFVNSRWQAISPRSALVMAALSAVTGLLVLFLRSSRAALIVASATMVAVIFALQGIAPAIADNNSSRRLIEMANERGYSQTPLFGLERNDRTPEFYAAGRVVYGEDHEPVMYDSLGQVIYQSHLHKGTMLFLIPLRELDGLKRAESLQSEVIANNGDVAIVAVTPL
jgi:4-amino-4-deoxy-L-arabinose transferase-like glycosyltransferase